MNNKNTMISLAIALVCPLVMGDAYNYEVSLDHLQTDADFTEADVTNLRGTYYLRPVTTKDVPLSEAAFLNQASNLTVGFEKRSAEQSFVVADFALGPPDLVIPPISFDVPPNGGVLADGPLYRPIGPINIFPIGPGVPSAGGLGGGDQDTFSAGGEYITQNGWIAGLQYSRASDDSASTLPSLPSSFDIEIEMVRFSVGKYFGPMTTVSFEYLDGSNEFESVFESFLFSPFFPTSTSTTVVSRGELDSSTRGYTLKAKSLRQQWGQLHKLELEVGYDVLDSRNTFSNVIGDSPPQVTTTTTKSYAKRWAIGYAFYPRNDIEIGLGFSSVNPEFGKQDSLNFMVEWFVKPRIALRANYVSTNSDQSFADSDGFGVGVTGRF